MATHKSAAKRARQSVKRSVRKSSIRSGVRTFEKKLRTVLNNKDAESAQKLLNELTSKLDKAAKRGAVHFKAASRKISRLSSQVSSLLKK